MKIEKKLLAALIAASLSVTGVHADDKSKTQNEPSGADASAQAQSDAASADAQLQIEKEPAGAESDASKDAALEVDSSAKIDEPAGAEAEDDADAKSPEKFVMKASQGGMMEVKAGQLAAQKAQSSSVKQYGDKLARDHQKANDQLKTIAEKKGITVSDQLEQKHQKHLDHLSSLSGEEFDKEFLKQSAMHHKKDIKAFEKQSKEGEDPAIRSFASETLPTLKAHLKIAEQLQENRNASVPELREPAGAEAPSQDSDSSQSQDQSQGAIQSDPAGAQPDAQSSGAASDSQSTGAQPDSSSSGTQSTGDSSTSGQP